MGNLASTRRRSSKLSCREFVEAKQNILRCNESARIPVVNVFADYNTVFFHQLGKGMQEGESER